jgi:hypothetical protein
MIGGGIENHVAHGQLRTCLANVDGRPPFCPSWLKPDLNEARVAWDLSLSLGVLCVFARVIVFPLPQTTFQPTM